MKTLRWLLVVVVVVAAAAGVFVGRGLWVSRQVSQAQDQAAAELHANLPLARGDAERDLDAVVRAAKVGEPTQMWRQLVCEVDNQDAGMFLVDYYYQRCFIHSVALVPTDVALGPTDEERAADMGYCDSDPVPRRRTLLQARIATAGPEEVVDCADTLLEPFQIESRTTLLVEGSEATLPALQASPYWVVAVADTEVSSTELGCAPWKVLFCHVPVDAPTM